MANPNYGFEKRQRELAKKKKQDAKDAKKREARAAAAGTPDGDNDAVHAPAEPEAPQEPAAPAEPAPRVHLRPAHGDSDT